MTKISLNFQKVIVVLKLNVFPIAFAENDFLNQSRTVEAMMSFMIGRLAKIPFYLKVMTVFMQPKKKIRYFIWLDPIALYFISFYFLCTML